MKRKTPGKRATKTPSKSTARSPPVGLAACLWLDKDAEEAARYYASVFPRSRIRKVHLAPADFPNGKKGDVLLVEFVLDGRPFQALNGGPYFKPNEAVSFVVECKGQAELDRYYAALSAVPEAEQCGWVKDRFGVSWQLVPEILTRTLASRDKAKAQRVFEAMLPMKRLDVASIERAAAPGRARGR